MRQKIFVVACALVVLLVSMNTVGCEQTPTVLDVTNRGEITAILSREITPHHLSSFLQSYKEHGIILLSHKREINLIHISYIKRNEYVNGQWIYDLHTLLHMDARVLWLKIHDESFFIEVLVEDQLKIELHNEIDIISFIESYSEYGLYLTYDFLPITDTMHRISWDNDLIDAPTLFFKLYYDTRVFWVWQVYYRQT